MERTVDEYILNESNGCVERRLALYICPVAENGMETKLRNSNDGSLIDF